MESHPFYVGKEMWRLFKKRQDGDLRRLISAYRCFLKAAHQSENTGPLDKYLRGAIKWKGGFGKAYQQLFQDWPTPYHSRLFEKKMKRWLKRMRDPDRAFIVAFNDYLKQRRLSVEELNEVLTCGRKYFAGRSPGPG